MSRYLIAIVAIFALLSVANALTYVSSCPYTVATSNEYYSISVPNITQTDAVAPCITISQVENVIFDLNGSIMNTSIYGNLYDFWIYESRNITIANGTITGFTHQFYIDNSSYITIRNITSRGGMHYVYDVQQFVVYATTNVSNLTYENNTVMFLIPENAAIWIYPTDVMGENITIQNNNFINLTKGPNQRLYNYTIYLKNIENSTIRNNYFENLSDGVLIEWARNLTILSNYITGENNFYRMFQFIDVNNSLANDNTYVQTGTAPDNMFFLIRSWWNLIENTTILGTFPTESVHVADGGQAFPASDYNHGLGNDNDIYAGSAVSHNSFRPPTITDVFVSPQIASEQATLTCFATVKDLDFNYVNVSFKWYLNGTYQPAYDSTDLYQISANGLQVASSVTVPSSALRKGDLWKCSVQANDTFYNSSWVNSSEIRIGYIRECGEILYPGEYEFENNITTTTGYQYCINVRSSDVEIDGAGKFLWQDAPQSGGVRTWGTTHNVTLHNLTISWTIPRTWYYAGSIYFASTTNSTIYNITINRTRGYIYLSNNVTFENNTVKNAYFVVSGSNKVTLRNNKFLKYAHGSYTSYSTIIWTGSNNGRIINNTIDHVLYGQSRTTYGLYLYNSRNNIIENNSGDATYFIYVYFNSYNNSGYNNQGLIEFFSRNPNDNYIDSADANGILRSCGSLTHNRNYTLAKDLYHGGWCVRLYRNAKLDCNNHRVVSKANTTNYGIAARGYGIISNSNNEIRNCYVEADYNTIENWDGALNITNSTIITITNGVYAISSIIPYINIWNSTIYTNQPRGSYNPAAIMGKNNLTLQNVSVIGTFAYGALSMTFSQADTWIRIINSTIHGFSGGLAMNIWIENSTLKAPQNMVAIAHIGDYPPFLDTIKDLFYAKNVHVYGEPNSTGLVLTSYKRAILDNVTFRTTNGLLLDYELFNTTIENSNFEEMNVSILSGVGVNFWIGTKYDTVVIQNVTIRNNTFRNIIYAGILSEKEMEHSVIENNTFLNTSIFGPALVDITVVGGNMTNSTYLLTEYLDFGNDTENYTTANSTVSVYDEMNESEFKHSTYQLFIMHTAIDLANTADITIKDNIITNSTYGIFFNNVSDSLITRVNISESVYGIYLNNSHNNDIIDSTIRDSTYGIFFNLSDSNYVYWVFANLNILKYGAWLTNTSNNNTGCLFGTIFDEDENNLNVCKYPVKVQGSPIRITCPYGTIFNPTTGGCDVYSSGYIAVKVEPTEIQTTGGQGVFYVTNIGMVPVEIHVEENKTKVITPINDFTLDINETKEVVIKQNKPIDTAVTVFARMANIDNSPYQYIKDVIVHPEKHVFDLGAILGALYGAARFLARRAAILLLAE